MYTDQQTSAAPYLSLSMDEGSSYGTALKDAQSDSSHDALIDAPEQRRVRLQSVGFDGMGQASTFSSISNLANTIMGSGMLGLPHAFAESGYVLGTVFLLVAATAASAALHMLSVCAQRTGTPSSFYSVCKFVAASVQLESHIFVNRLPRRLSRNGHFSSILLWE